MCGEWCAYADAFVARNKNKEEKKRRRCLHLFCEIQTNAGRVSLAVSHMKTHMM